MLPAGLRAHRVEAAAALLGALLALVVVLAVHGSAASDPHGRTAAARPAARTSRRAQAPASVPASSNTRTAAVAAATSYLLAVGNAAVGDPAAARRVATVIATGPLRTQLQQALPTLAASIRARVNTSKAPTAFNGWPLGYRVLVFNRSAATVAVWHLDIAASSALDLSSVDYATTTYHLRFLAGTWRIVRVTTGAGPTPPPVTARGRQLDAFARTAHAFSVYRYAP